MKRQTKTYYEVYATQSASTDPQHRAGDKLRLEWNDGPQVSKDEWRGEACRFAALPPPEELEAWVAKPWNCVFEPTDVTIIKVTETITREEVVSEPARRVAAYV